MAIFTRVMLASVSISCRHVYDVVRPSVTGRCSTETAKRRITQTPHDSLKISGKRKRGHLPTEAPNACRYTKCSWRSWKLATVDVKHCQLSSVASLLHICRSAVHRVRFVSDSWSPSKWVTCQLVYLDFLSPLFHVCDGTEMVQVTPLRRTLCVFSLIRMC